MFMRHLALAAAIAAECPGGVKPLIGSGEPHAGRLYRRWRPAK
jgi:hypothetical protein